MTPAQVRKEIAKITETWNRNYEKIARQRTAAVAQFRETWLAAAEKIRAECPHKTVHEPWEKGPIVCKDCGKEL